MKRRCHMAWVLALAALAAAPAGADDGAIEINQSVALAGTIPGDAPGFPVRLVNRGSYRLTGDLVVPLAALYGIEVVAEGCTLDLGGFSIIGPSTCTGSGATLTCTPDSGDLSNIGIRSLVTLTLRNGMVRGMASYGLELYGGGIVEDIIVVGNAAHGLLASRSTVRRVIAAGNDGAGIDCSGCALGEVIATGNGGRGIDIGIETTLQRSVARGNGFSGIYAFAATVLQYTASFGNAQFGLGGSTVGGGNAYGQNAIQGNVGTVQTGIGEVQLGSNLCEGDTSCP